MRRHSARLWPHLAIFALSVSLLGCGSNPPPTPSPEDPTPPQSERPVRDSGQAPIPKAFTSGGPATPVDLRSDAPAPDAQPQGSYLTQPGQPPVSLDDLQGGLPTKIPQGMAGSLLRPLDQGPVADVRAPGLGAGVGDGCAYGALPDLVEYGVYPRLLYYPFHSCWVPYILVDDCYYPYVYQPYFDPLYAGYCYYPLFVFRHGYYYPYYFHSRAYYYGYLDWEYNWHGYREHHGDYDWDEIGRRHPRRYNDDDFQDWREGRIHRRDRADYQRPEPPRRGQSGGEGHGGGDRPAPRKRPKADPPARQDKVERQGPEERSGGERPRKGAASNGGQEKERPQRQEQGARDARAHAAKERGAGERAAKQEGHEGQKGKSGRRLQSEEDEDADQVD